MVNLKKKKPSFTPFNLSSLEKSPTEHQPKSIESLAAVGNYYLTDLLLVLLDLLEHLLHLLVLPLLVALHLLSQARLGSSSGFLKIHHK